MKKRLLFVCFSALTVVGEIGIELAGGAGREEPLARSQIPGMAGSRVRTMQGIVIDPEGKPTAGVDVSSTR